ncbi:MAG: hypothetical protein ACHQ50_14210, partial [Fimbriimonadales bacterium]
SVPVMRNLIYCTSEGNCQQFAFLDQDEHIPGPFLLFVRLRCWSIYGAENIESLAAALVVNR